MRLRWTTFRKIGLLAFALAAIDRALKETGIRSQVLLPWWLEQFLYVVGLAVILAPVFKTAVEFVPKVAQDRMKRLAANYLWNYSRGPVTWEPYQRNCTGHEGGAVYVAQFNITGTVKRGPLRFSEAYVVSHVTQERRQALIDTVNGYRPVDQTDPIGSGAIIRIKVLFYDPLLSVRPQGQTEAEFMASWRQFSFVTSYGRRYHIEVSPDEVMAFINAVRVKPYGGPPLPTPYGDRGSPAPR